jgi:hypothetical protein
VKSAEQLPAILFTGLSFNAKIWSSPLSSGTLKRQRPLGLGTSYRVRKSLEEEELMKN